MVMEKDRRRRRVRMEAGPYHRCAHHIEGGQIVPEVVILGATYVRVDRGNLAARSWPSRPWKGIPWSRSSLGL